MSHLKRFNIMQLFSHNLPLLQILSLSFFKKLKKTNPKIYHHIKIKLKIPDGLWIVKWILTIFIISLPLE